LAAQVENNKQQIETLGASIQTLLEIACDEAIDNAKSEEKKKIAKKRCTPKKRKI